MLKGSRYPCVRRSEKRCTRAVRGLNNNIITPSSKTVYFLTRNYIHNIYKLWNKIHSSTHAQHNIWTLCTHTYMKDENLHLSFHNSIMIHVILFSFISLISFLSVSVSISISLYLLSVYGYLDFSFCFSLTLY